MNISKVEKLSDIRNGNKTLKNRDGPEQLQYELLRRYSGPGLTGKGVPNSVCI
jgi:lipoxygenase